MDAIKFIKERNRMCATYTPKRCEGCPIKLDNDEACIMINRINAEKVVPIVEDWSKTHPRKTRQSEFLKLYPDVAIDGQGVVGIQPCVIEKSNFRNRCHDFSSKCAECLKDYWTQEVD